METATSRALSRVREDLGNWRLLAVKFVSATVSIVLTIALLPGLTLTDLSWGELLVIGLLFGVLNAVLKPILQFFTLRYLVASYGFIVILINAALLLVVALVLGDRLEVSRAGSLLVGGALVGLLGLLFDTLLGTNRPVLDRPSEFEQNDKVTT